MCEGEEIPCQGCLRTQLQREIKIFLFNQFLFLLINMEYISRDGMDFPLIEWNGHFLYSNKEKLELQLGS